MADIQTFEQLKETPKHMEAAAVLFGVFYPQTPPERYEEKTEDLACFGIVDEEVLVGIGGLSLQHKDVGIIGIDFLVVDPEKRHKKHGSTLVAALVKHAFEEQNADSVTLFTKPGNGDFLKFCGFGRDVNRVAFVKTRGQAEREKVT